MKSLITILEDSFSKNLSGAFWCFFWAWLGGFLSMSLYYIIQSRLTWMPGYGLRTITLSSLFGTMIGILTLVIARKFPIAWNDDLPDWVYNCIWISGSLVIGMLVWLVDKIAIDLLYDKHIYFCCSKIVFYQISIGGLGLSSGLIISTHLQIHVLALQCQLQQDELNYL